MTQIQWWSLCFHHIKENYMDSHVRWVSGAPCRDVDMNSDIWAANPLWSDNNASSNFPSHLTVILPVVIGSPAADTDALSEDRTQEWVQLRIRFVPQLSNDTNLLHDMYLMNSFHYRAVNCLRLVMLVMSLKRYLDAVKLPLLAMKSTLSLLTVCFLLAQTIFSQPVRATKLLLSC